MNPGDGVATDMATGVTEVHGTAEDLQDVLFAGAEGERPAAEGFADPDEVAAAAEGAATGLEVSGGVFVPGTDGGGAVRVDTVVVEATAGSLAHVAEELGGALAALAPATAELQLWSLSGQAPLGEAAALGGLVGLRLWDVVDGVAATGARLLLVALRYEVLENALTGAFSRQLLDTPLGAVGGSVVREVSRTAEDVDVALARAGIDSPAEFTRRVRVSALGVVVQGGGPRGTDAVIRGPGLDDVLDALLQVPVGTGAAAAGQDGSGHRDGAAHGAAGRDGSGADGGAAPGADGAAAGDAADGAGAGTGAAASSGRTTLGQYLRGAAVELLTGYGTPGEDGSAGRGADATDPGASDPDVSDPDAKDPEATLRRALAPVVAAMALHAVGPLRGYAPWRTGRRLSPAEALGRGAADALRPWLADRALRPATREVFTAVTPATAAAHHMTGAASRPLPAGIGSTGSIPTTVAGTAATLKEAKNIVSGAAADGEPLENSTVMVQKATDAQGHRAFSVVLTGTEEWMDGPGVHDLKGIADGMTTTPGAALADLPQAQRMAVQALQDAGIRQGDAVVLSGHSLGGIDAAGLAANTEFRSLYDVQAVTTYGAPVGDFAIPDATSVMAVEHVDDVVPALDGVANPDSAHRSTVRVNTPYASALVPDQGHTGVGAHDMNLYAVGAQGISQSQHPAVQAHERRLADVVPHGAGTRTETYVYEGWEEH